MVLFGERLLPDPDGPSSIPTDFSRHARRSSSSTGSTTRPDADRAGRSGLAEVVIPPRSALVGDTVFPGMVTESGDLVVLAVQRKGEEHGPGRRRRSPSATSLLLQGSWAALDENLADPDLLVVDKPDLVRRQVVPLGLGAAEALVILAAMVVALATGVVPSVVAGLLAAGAMVLLRRRVASTAPTGRSPGRRSCWWPG